MTVQQPGQVPAEMSYRSGGGGTIFLPLLALAVFALVMTFTGGC